MRCRDVTDMLVGHIPQDAKLDEHLRGCASCRQIKRMVQGLEAEGEHLRRRDLDTARIQATRHAVVSALNEQHATTHHPWILRPVGISLTAVAAAVLCVSIIAQMNFNSGNPSPMVRQSDTPVPVAPPVVVIGDLDTSFVERQADLRTSLNGFRKRYGLVSEEDSVDSDFRDLRNRLATVNAGYAHERRMLKMINGSGGYNE